MSCLYDPNRINESNHLEQTRAALDTYNKKHENIY